MTAPLHLINPMLQVSGAEMRTVDLYRLLSRHGDVTVWGHRRAPAELRTMVPLRTLSPLTLQFPRTGVLVVMGAYFNWFLRRWYWATRPERTILLYNLHDPDDLRDALALVSRGGRRAVDMVYASDVLQREAGIPGFVEDSPIDLAAFARGVTRTTRPDAFVVGRCGRDVDFKYAEGDAAVFRELAARGCSVRLVGGTCLGAKLGDTAGVELLPEIPQRRIPEFLAGLDCFVYRTAPSCQEAYGRVVAEALACGVPVVVEARVGASKHIEHGVNGYIANTDAEVIAAVERLRLDPALRASMSAAAKASIARAHTPEQKRAIVDFYFRPSASGVPAGAGAVS